MGELAGGRGEQIMIVMVTRGSRGQQSRAAGAVTLLWQQPPNLGLGLGSEVRIEWQLGPGRWRGGGRQAGEAEEGSNQIRGIITDRLSTDGDPTLWLSTDHDPPNTHTNKHVRHLGFWAPHSVLRTG